MLSMGIVFLLIRDQYVSKMVFASEQPSSHSEEGQKSPVWLEVKKDVLCTHIDVQYNTVLFAIKKYVCLFVLVSVNEAATP